MISIIMVRVRWNKYQNVKKQSLVDPRNSDSGASSQTSALSVITCLFSVDACALLSSSWLKYKGMGLKKRKSMRANKVYDINGVGVEVEI